MSAPAPGAPRPRFYRRRRFWAWSGLAALAAAIAALGLLYWLLQTVAGRDVLLAQIVSRLPAGASLSWDRAEGPLAGPLTLHGLDFRYQDYRFTARRAYLDPDIRPLLGRRLRLDAFELEGAELGLARSDEPFELPRWPQSLPAIEMPIAIQADRIAVDGLKVSSGGEPLIDIRSLRGGIDVANGSLHAERLQVDSDLGLFSVHGDYQPARDYRADLQVTAVFPAPRGRSPARLGLIARGDLSGMEVGIGGRAPEPLRATLSLGGDQDAPRWRLQARSDGLDPALLLGGEPMPEPLAFHLQAQGEGGAAQLQGGVRHGGQDIVVAPSQLRLENQVLEVLPLVLELYEGRVRLRGTADFTDPQDARFRFALDTQGIRLQGQDPAAPAIGVEATLGLAGTLQRWAAYGEATLQRGGEQAAVELDVRGDAARARIHALRASMPTGTLQASGEAGWDPRLDWDLTLALDGFDPGYFVPGWDGRVNGRLASRGQARDDAGFDAQVELEDLGGRLRGRALDGSGRFALRGEEGEGALALALGESRLRAQGRIAGERIDVQAHAQPLRLDDLLPDAAGNVQGELRLTGSRHAPDLHAALQVRGLRWDDWAAQALDLQGHLPWRGRGGDLALTATDLQAGLPVQRLAVRARGAVEDLQLEAEAESAQAARLSLAGHARRRGGGWQGTLERLRIAPVRGQPWSLQAPAEFSIAGARTVLQPACLAVAESGDGDASLCAQADWPRQGLSVTSQRLPLTLLHPWLPRNEGRALVLRGDLTLDAHLRPQANRWTGEVHLASPDGGLRLGDRTRREIFRYDQFSFDLAFDPTRIHGRLGSGFKGDGYIDATFDTGWDGHSPLTGEIYTYMSQLFWLELLSPDLVRPRGVVRGHVSLRGTRGQPALGGQLLLEDFQGELPVLGLALSEGKGSLDAQPDGSARIAASVKSGEGTLHVDGGLSWYGQATPLQLRIHGRDVLVSDTAMLRAVAAPDLRFSLRGKTMVLDGEVAVPSATINLERLDQGASVSEDVVVADPVDPEEAPSAPLEMDLALVLGDQVELSGYGLDGSLQGRLQVRARPGREMTATGALDVAGKYEAYGQQLQISRGQMTWSNNLVTDPRVNLRAERRIGDVTAGIDVTGNALQPRVEVWSNPSMPQSEALSYLILGRSLEGATRAQANQVTAASAAMSAGTSLLAARLGAKLGFDDAGVTQSRALGGSVVGVGKYLSPKLYIGYGVSMVGSGQVLILKYLLRKGFDLEIESSTVETRGSVNWRRER
ncbi:pathogenicity protein [Pseudoxanthomonas broegbernensis]|uniref:Pathogenicity protein n=1 Tax=Pseudoxanthomonas broegbernensis TaxID=83619 RepID=A0A7V8GND9_9GAMM|nr:translocation/assembly module TamB domain-containing protein [Pseudoxanthomonas broegbernensis]KAF1686912.1 pathogenicity protein [Pseudoxanthomonas broegbernensis]MBB6065491.1 translocation and assembly module TamB [Pseudoxanthomonas broegbernensis]